MGQHRALIEVVSGCVDRFANVVDRVADAVIPPVRAKVRSRVVKRANGRALAKVDRRANGAKQVRPGVGIKAGDWRYIKTGEGDYRTAVVISHVSALGTVYCCKPNCFTFKNDRKGGVDRRAGWCAGYTIRKLHQEHMAKVPKAEIDKIVARIGLPPHAIGGGN